MRLRLLLAGGLVLAGLALGLVLRGPSPLEGPAGAGERAATSAPDTPTPAPSTLPSPGVTAGAAGATPTATAAPSPTTAGGGPSPTPTPDPEVRALRRRLDDVLAARGLARRQATVSVAVRDSRGSLVYGHRADARSVPASTTKLVTAATVLAVLGPGHRLVTTVDTAARIRGGTLDGDLVLTGGGDPVLATRGYERFVYPARPRTPLEDLADEVAARGVRVVAGDLVADPSLLSGPAVARGWRDEYLSDLNGRPVRGLTVDGGLAVDFHGEPAVETMEVEPVRDPARRAAVQLRRLLAERGVTVRGDLRVSDEPVAAPTTLARVRSPRTERLVTHMVRESDNHLADTLIRVAAAARGRDGSWSGAAATARVVLEGFGVDTTGMVVADGSGLSRADRLTAAQLTALDAAMARSRHARVWSRIKAVAGRSGTLERRLDETVADGAFRGKTGTLRDVVAVAGAVHGPDGERFHVAVIGNRADGERGTVRALADELVLVLAEQQRDCHRRPRPDPSPSAPAPHVPPYELVCPGS